ncbi:MAG: exodeoxyribonuclease VII small subunit [Dorea sp.]|jgi:Exonuclease VII small subunit|nr:exodeoxyribonuclease VII small subunit [Dorea sp.]MDE6939007.1 exodeoxyribonuclease VII small subunit [Lachnospiraceae bacterium]MDE7036945.1 exodeoxyribonuclease VII small subunit [Lachnospiraceae bacterium]
MTRQDKSQDVKEELSLEELFQSLEETIRRMEAEDVSLEDSFTLYHKGMDTLRMCSERIDEVEKKMLVLDEEGEMHEF